MLQGVNRAARKRHPKCAPNFLQGVMLRTQQCHTSITSKGAISASRQRHFSRVPTSFIWCQPSIAESHFEHAPREGSVSVRRNALQKPPFPTSYRGPLRDRSNATSIPPPPVLFGAVMTTQQCQGGNAPREGSPIGHSNVIRAAPFPPVTGGHQRHAEMPDDLRPHRIWAIGMPQKCH